MGAFSYYTNGVPEDDSGANSSPASQERIRATRSIYLTHQIHTEEDPNQVCAHLAVS